MRYFLIVSFFLLTAIAAAQEPASIQLTEKDGLPDLEFYDLLADDDGYIWLAANKGLYRYDGRDYKLYTNDTKRGLSVFELSKDSRGRIWCTNITGQFFYIENDKLITFADMQKELKGKLVRYKVTDSELLVFGLTKLHSISLDTKQKSTLVESAMVSRIGVNQKDILFTSNDSIFEVKSDTVIERLNYKGIRAYEEVDNLFQGLPQLITTASDTFVIIGENIGIKAFKVSNNKVFPSSVLDKIRHLKINRTIKLETRFYFCTTQGLHIYDNNLGYTTTYLKDRMITQVCIDKDKNLWVSTLSSGIFVIPNLRVLTYEQIPTDVSCVDQLDANSIVFGTTKGEYGTYDFAQGKSTIQSLEVSSKVIAITLNPYKNLLYLSQVHTGQIVNLGSTNSITESAFENAKEIILLDSTSILFTSYYGAVFLEDPVNENKNENRSHLSQNRAYTCYRPNQADEVYVGFINGLVRYDEDLREHKIRHGDESIFAFGLTETSDKMIWAATVQKGIYGIKNDVVKVNLGVHNGLASNSISQIKSDGNNLWIVTDKAIQYYKPQTKEIVTLSREDGIPSFKINGIEVLDSVVVFASSEGIFTIDRSEISKVNRVPRAEFRNIKIMGRDTSLLDHYILDYDVNQIELEVISKSFRSSQELVYQYRISSSSDSWEEQPVGVNKINFNSLSSGTYNVSVRAKHIINNGYSEPISLRITIKKPYWEKWSFLGLAFCLLTAIVVYILKRVQRVALQRKEAALKEAISDRTITTLKLENLRSQMNPHFIFNALNSIQEYIILNEKNQASNYLGKFSDLIRSYLTSSAKETIAISDEKEALDTYLQLEQMRFEESFTYQLTFDDELLYGNYELPTMLLQPYLENAINHGLLHKKGQKNLALNARKKTAGEQSLMEVIIEDNGVGRAKAGEIAKRRNPNHQSFSTKATEDRLNLLNQAKKNEVGIKYQDLKDEHNTSLGTRVIITIPLKSSLRL